MIVIIDCAKNSKRNLIRYCIIVTKIKQERTDQDVTKIGPFFYYLIILLEIFNIASKLSSEAMIKILIKIN